MEMTKTTRLKLLIILLLPMISCDNSSTTKSNLDVDKAAIETIIDEHLDALDSLDVERLLNCMTEDHVEMPAKYAKTSGQTSIQ